MIFNYKKTTWINEKTPIDATKLNNIEHGIESLSIIMDNIDKSLKKLETNVPKNISQLYNDMGYLTEVSKSDIGLDNVDNTSDLNKPVSNKQQQSLDTKQNILISGKNISTINGHDLTNGGDIEIIEGKITEFNKPVSPVFIEGFWEFFNNNNKPIDIHPTPNINNPILEIGYKAKFKGTYKWVKSDDSTKSPIGISPESSWKDLPENNKQSDQFESELLSTNSVIRAKLYAPKMGYIVVNQNVVPATGNDYVEASNSVYFKYRSFYGCTVDNNITESLIKNLKNNYLTTTRGNSLNNITTKDTEYFIYAYPKSLGNLTSIIQDGATPILGAFSYSTINIKNDAGKIIEYNIYITNNKGSFSNASLKFI